MDFNIGSSTMVGFIYKSLFYSPLPLSYILKVGDSSEALHYLKELTVNLKSYLSQVDS